MIPKKYYYFIITNTNQTKIKKEIQKLINTYKNTYEIIGPKNIPPCFKLKLTKKKINLIKKNNIIINHNIFCGNEFKKVNKKFKNSPYITNKCKKCNYFKNNFCRGIFNKKFYEKKQKIINKYGNKIYNAIYKDYYQGFAGYSSECNSQCFFCIRNNLKAKKILPFIPELTIDEIMHFNHYLSQNTKTNTFANYCMPGEPTFTSQLNKKLKITKFFSDTNFILITNGLNLNSTTIKDIKKLKMKTHLSLHTINEKTREKLMNHKNNFNISNIIKELIKQQINFRINILPFKTIIQNKELIKTLKYLKKHNIKYHINYPILSEDTKVNQELNHKHPILLRIKKNETQERIQKETSKLKTILKKNKNKKILILTNHKLKINSKNITIKKIKGTLTKMIPPPKNILIQDYIKQIKETKNKPDVIVVRKSFDFLFEDMLGNNINKLFDTINKDIYLI